MSACPHRPPPPACASGAASRHSVRRHYVTASICYPTSQACENRCWPWPQTRPARTARSGRFPSRPPTHSKMPSTARCSIALPNTQTGWQNSPVLGRRWRRRTKQTSYAWLAGTVAHTMRSAGLITSRMKPRSVPKHSGAISMQPSTSCFRQANRRAWRAGFRGATPPNTRGDAGQHDSTSGWTVLPVPG
ncbi:hypothetical protein D3C72_1327760 [compost metagenome]